jgi:hypothetical protein
LARALLRLALGACLALAASSLVPRAAYLAQLAALPDARARGALAADERLSPLATAGQVRWRRELDRRDREGRAGASGLSLAWRFFVDTRERLPPGSRVLLARPNDALYQFGNFLWHPTRLEVAPEVSAPLADGDDLRRAAAGRDCSERAWLRDEGYAGCVEAVGARLRLVTPGETR